MAGQARGKVTVDVEECKGCGLCVESCPPKCLELAPELNTYGAHPGALHRTELHGLWNLLLLLPGTRRDHRLPHESESAERSCQRREATDAAAL